MTSRASAAVAAIPPPRLQATRVDSICCWLYVLLGSFYLEPDFAGPILGGSRGWYLRKELVHVCCLSIYALNFGSPVSRVTGGRAAHLHVYRRFILYGIVVDFCSCCCINGRVNSVRSPRTLLSNPADVYRGWAEEPSCCSAEQDP